MEEREKKNPSIPRGGAGSLPIQSISGALLLGEGRTAQDPRPTRDTRQNMAVTAGGEQVLPSTFVLFVPLKLNYPSAFAQTEKKP